MCPGGHSHLSWHRFYLFLFLCLITICIHVCSYFYQLRIYFAASNSLFNWSGLKNNELFVHRGLKQLAAGFGSVADFQLFFFILALKMLLCISQLFSFACCLIGTRWLVYLQVLYLCLREEENSKGKRAASIPGNLSLSQQTLNFVSFAQTCVTWIPQLQQRLLKQVQYLLVVQCVDAPPEIGVLLIREQILGWQLTLPFDRLMVSSQSPSLLF